MLGGEIRITLAALCLAATTGCASLDLGWQVDGNSPSIVNAMDSAAAESVATPATARPQPVFAGGSEPGTAHVVSTAISGERLPRPHAAAFLTEANLQTPADAGEHRNLDAVRPEMETDPDDLWIALRSGFQLPTLEQDPERVARFERWYAKHPKYFERLAERAYWFLPYVLTEVNARQMPAEVAILPAIESAFRPDATSRSRAAGMWQFISATGRRFGLRQDWWMDGRRDLVQSTRAALDYLEYLSLEFNGDWQLAFAAYNAGEGTIRKKVRQNKSKGLPTNYANLKLRRETAEYVPRLLAIRNILRDPARFNITLPAVKNVHRLQVVDLQSQTDLTVIASMISLSRKQLHFLNLGYTRGVTPPNGPHTIVVPADEVDKVNSGLAGLSVRDRMQWARHKVKKGEVLGRIARLHGVSVAGIRRANSIKGNLIKPGQELRIPLSGGAKYAGSATVENDSSEKKKHLVSRGDTLWNISRRYRVSLNSLLRWNQLTRKSILQPGQSIVVIQ